MRKLLLGTILSLTTKSALAVCPICTVAVASGLCIFEKLGIDNSIGGVWIGGLTVSLILWTASWLKKRGINSPLAWAINIIVYYAFALGVYLMPGFEFGQSTLCGLDKLLFGIILGSLGLLAGNYWYTKIKERNGGHALFPFQKVVMPVGFLLAISLVLALVVYL